MRNLNTKNPGLTLSVVNETTRPSRKELDFKPVGARSGRFEPGVGRLLGNTRTGRGGASRFLNLSKDIRLCGTSTFPVFFIIIFDSGELLNYSNSRRHSFLFTSFLRPTPQGGFWQRLVDGSLEESTVSNYSSLDRSPSSLCRNTRRAATASLTMRR